MKQSRIINSQSTLTKTLVILGIIFIAFNLRPALTSIGPLIDMIRTDMNISSSAAGLLTAVPLLAFAFISPLAPKIGNRVGYEWTIVATLTILTIGIFIRSMPFLSTLFLGTVLIGVGIAICNVLLPAIVKYYFPNKIGLMTGIYTTTLGVSASIISGLSIPIAQGLGWGWNNTLLLTGILSIAAIIVWLPQLFFQDKITNKHSMKVKDKSLWKSKIAWEVTFFMGLQSLLFYCLLTWLPIIMISKEMSTSLAGLMVSLVIFAGIPGSFYAPILANRLSDQRLIGVGISTAYLIGVIGVLLFESITLLVISTAIMGFASGSALGFSFALFGLRTKDSNQAANLSGMAQSIGYLLAAIGPIFLGLLFDLMHSWTMPLIVLIVTCILMGLTSLGAGRNQYVDDSFEKAKETA